MNLAQPCVLAFLALSACHARFESVETTLASATIGSEGGTLTVTSGPQAGLVLTIPPGALSSATAFRVVLTPTSPNPPETSEVTPPGRPFRIEPVDVTFQESATLRMPFMPEVLMLRTGLGNVRIRQQSISAAWDRVPLLVDVTGRVVETRLTIGGTFQVVEGPSAASLQEYFPARGSTTTLLDGTVFSVEPFVDVRFPGRDLELWRIHTAAHEFALLREGGSFVGRYDWTQGWLEMWPGQGNNPASLVHVAYGYAWGETVVTNVYTPATSPLSVGGTVQLRTAWSFQPPVQVGAQTHLDVMQLRVGVRWNRGDIAPGEGEHVFTFARGVGLVGLQ